MSAIPARPAAERPPVSSWGVFLIASVAVFLVSIDATVLYAAFPALRRGFPLASAAELSWVLNAYTVIYAALTVPSGRLADLHGRKRMFLSGVAIFLFASVACGAASSEWWLIAARALQAVGAALLLPASLAIVLAAFPADKRAVAVSAWGAVGALAAALGPSIGSFVVDLWGWPWAFYLNLPFGLYSLWRGARVLDESRNPENGASLDLVGVLLLVLGVGGIAFGVVHAEAQGWTSPQVLAPVIAGPLALVLFVAWSHRVASPAIDLTLFRHPTYRYVNLAMLCFGIGFAMMFFAFFLFMASVWHYPLSLAGLAATPGPLTVVPVAIFSGRLAARFGHRPLLVAGSVVFALGNAWLGWMPSAQPDYLVAWLPGLLLTGVGTGMVMPSLSGAAVARLAPNRFGVGSAVNQAVRQVGAVMGVALTIVLVGREPVLHDFRVLFTWVVGWALLCGLLCLPVDTRPVARR